MGAFLLVTALLAGIVVLTPVADRIRVPQPILLLLYGLALALLPGTGAPYIPAELVLPVVLPPLLFAATQRATAGQFREAARPVLLLAVGLTVATAVVAALVARAAGLPWEAAAVLGAIVSPPDPVAATAVARRLRLPERMVTILEGEGMFNDATALVLYKVTLAVALTGELSAGGAVLELVLAVAVGVGAGLLLGWATKQALALLHDAEPETTVTIAAPFVAYLGAEHLRGSGVLAVLVLGLYLRSYAHPALTARGWLLGRSVWEYADFLITSVVFVLVGFELTKVLAHSSTDAGTVRLAVLVLLAVVLFRPVWLFTATKVARARSRRSDGPMPYGWRETAVVSWAGMRGVVTVATALALPASAADGTDLAWREPVVLVGLLCVLVTLVLQGLTLTPLVRRLGVGSDSDEEAEAVQLRREAMQAAADAIRADREADQGEEVDGHRVPDRVREAVIAQYEGRLRGQQLLEDVIGDHSGREEAEEVEEALRRVLQRGNDVERDVVLRARSSGTVTPAAADEVLHDIETRASRTGI